MKRVIVFCFATLVGAAGTLVLSAHGATGIVALRHDPRMPLPEASVLERLGGEAAEVFETAMLRALEFRQRYLRQNS
ncbi:hypothetical protein [Palleronia sp. LCG004]|uniref:hypothetical protein n=1 Tax=Palleronia sp. LCG004 TaxID=3079304 RepID=UPI002942B601|nr:hypothetical protein [Palleronia sp. LCG004]WOI55283.1 hypothetical protein RVY76_09495 [Palleronia sp. LCG004]